MQTKANELNNDSIDTTLPDDFKNLISQDEYVKIINIIIEYFRNKPEKIARLTKGMLYVTGEDKETEFQYSLNNLVRRLMVTDAIEWLPAIFSFFNNSKVNLSAHNFFFKDYDHAGQYLKILVKPKNFINKAMKDQLVLTSHFPGTLSALVFNYDRQFRYLQHDNIKEWGVSEGELFARALQNVAMEKVLTKGVEVEKGVQIYAMISAEYSASRMIEIEKNNPYLIGKQGTIFTIPANGTAFAAPMDNESAMKKISRRLMFVTAEAFKVEPSPITFDLFHYHNGECHSMLDSIKEMYPDIYKLLMRKL